MIKGGKRFTWNSLKSRQNGTRRCSCVGHGMLSIHLWSTEELEDFQHVQNNIDELCSWLSSHKLSLNPKKCKSLLISRKRFPTVSLPFICMWMDQYLSEYHITDMLESWFPLTSLALTYTVVFISMLHQQPCMRTLNTALIVHIWNTHLLHGIRISARIIDALESVQRFTTKICTKRLEYELSVSFG